MKMITTVANIYVDNVTNYEATVKSRWGIGTWTAVRLERNKHITASEEAEAMDLTNVAEKGERERGHGESPSRLGKG